MKTLILPGFSSKNRSWAEDVKNSLGDDTEIIAWPHWETGNIEDNWKEKVVESLLNKYKNTRINIIAKSVGTIVSMMILKKNIDLINKIILCGIPTSDFQKNDESLYGVLKKMKVKNVLCVQNEEDPFASYKKIKKMIGDIQKNIKVISKKAKTHDYPYYGDFKNFLY